MSYLSHRQRLFFCVAILIFCSLKTGAQELLKNRPNQDWLRLSNNQFESEHYRLAIQSANAFLNHARTTHTSEDEKSRAVWIRTLSQLKLDDLGAEDSALQFLQQHVMPAYKQRVSLALAHYYFEHEQLTKAIPYFESAGIANLTNEEIAIAKFELAYAYFNSRRFDQATTLFASIKEVPGKYFVQGNYYYGLLAYNDSKYEEALNSFQRIQNEPQYKGIVPYYIAEIYYFTGARKKALEEAIRLTKQKDKLFYDNELYLLAAQVLFEEQRYGEALPFFEHYYDNVDAIRKEELYEMAYSYYRVNEWKHAIDKFKPLSDAQDSLGQTSMYLLGDCYLKAKDKKSARNAFGVCSDMSFNVGQQEASLLLYGKLSYELGFNQDAVRSFKSLIQSFPGSDYAGEAKTYLSDVLMKSQRYEEAYQYLKTVLDKSPDYWRVWQKATYGYAMDEYQQGEWTQAQKLLNASLLQPSDKAYEAAAYFWLGELATRNDRPEEALNYLKQFMVKVDKSGNVSKISPQATLANASLLMGYNAMNQNDYAAAQGYFAKAKDSDQTLSAIATAREADAAFMRKNYKDALALYDKAISLGGEDADYARLQKAIVLGAQGKSVEKISLLQQLATNQNSKYAGDARFELGSTLIEEEKYQSAINAMLPLTTDNNTRNFAARSWMKIGFAYQQLDNHKKAVDAYKHVVTDFPSSTERMPALDALKSLFVESNQPEAFAQLLKENNLPSAGSAQMDSTYYAAAEAQIAAAKWTLAKAALNNYLEKFPQGIFATRAHYYKAESQWKLKEYEGALPDFDMVLNQPWSEFTEPSAARAADIAYKLGRFDKAADYYAQLRNTAMSKEQLQSAYAGLMNAYYKNEKLDKAASYADTLSQIPDLNLTLANQAKIIKAKIATQKGHERDALTIYQSLTDASNTEVAAEARYRVAESFFKQGNLKEAESAAASALKLNAGNDFWIVKSYLLIADILTKQKDYFNAKATLQSLVKNTKIADLKKEAERKLDEVRKLEQQQSKLKQ
ncbi:MAG: tetratricopeptide repeat protein [Bacteroidetes bacterium]|nr:tetratricopeptide repeat protein [Bacteroidota bacterium]MBS1739725.1 tetratricopeptide repeat protein [Bacteroidota bacterium]